MQSGPSCLTDEGKGGVTAPVGSESPSPATGPSAPLQWSSFGGGSLLQPQRRDWGGGPSACWGQSRSQVTGEPWGPNGSWGANCHSPKTWALSEEGGGSWSGSPGPGMFGREAEGGEVGGGGRGGKSETLFLGKFLNTVGRAGIIVQASLGLPDSTRACACGRGTCQHAQHNPHPGPLTRLPQPPPPPHSLTPPVLKTQFKLLPKHLTLLSHSVSGKGRQIRQVWFLSRPISAPGSHLGGAPLPLTWGPGGSSSVEDISRDQLWRSLLSRAWPGLRLPPASSLHWPDHNCGSVDTLMNPLGGCHCHNYSAGSAQGPYRAGPVLLRYKGPEVQLRDVPTASQQMSPKQLLFAAGSQASYRESSLITPTLLPCPLPPP